MTVKGGPKIETDGLVFHLDAAAASIGKSYPIDGLNVEYLVVAGGGGGGGVIGGGGGAGGLLHGFTTASIGTGTYAVVIGAGGAGGTGWNTSGQDGKVGGNSSVFSITSSGGGGGVHYGGATSSTTKNGGSGGGGANGSYNGGTGVSGQGNNGGNNGNGNLGAGGGGAGSTGGNAGGTFGGAGGLGRYFGDKFGSVGYNGWFADGGAGGVRGYAGTSVRSASNGGGYGTSNTVVAGSGATNTGSGGGGGGYSGVSNNRIGGNGGSGIVLIRYKGSQKASGGDSIIKHRGYTIHVFTSSGNFVVGDRVGGTSRNKVVGELVNMNSSNFTNTNKGYWTFDGSNEKITYSIPSSLSDYSIAIWFNFISFSSDIVYNSIWSRNAGGTMSISWRTGYSKMTFGYNPLDTSLGSSITIGQTYGPTISTGYWYHICVTNDSSDTSSGASMYLNGNYIGSNGASTAMVQNSLIGSHYNDAFPANVKISSVQIHSRPLSEIEILDNYNATKGRFGL